MIVILLLTGVEYYLRHQRAAVPVEGPHVDDVVVRRPVLISRSTEDVAIRAIIGREDKPLLRGPWVEVLN